MEWTQQKHKNVYLENRAIWSELNKILDLLGISAE